MGKVWGVSIATIIFLVVVVAVVAIAYWMQGGGTVFGPKVPFVPQTIEEKAQVLQDLVASNPTPAPTMPEEQQKVTEEHLQVVQQVSQSSPQQQQANWPTNSGNTSSGDTSAQTQAKLDTLKALHSAQ